MDEITVKWVIEFLLRQQIDETIINSLISSLPTIHNDYRLKKTMLLRRIEIETSNGFVSENILELIEIIEELDHEEGINSSNLMKDAYCLVAVDCTVRFLEENQEENSKYMEMVDSVWNNRVCKSERLSSDESKRWFSEIEAAVENSEAYKKIWMINTRNEALKAVKMYLKDAWDCLGPPFLNSMATKWSNESSKFYSGVMFSDPEKSGASIRRKHVAVKSRSDRGVKISDVDEDAMKKAGDATAETVEAEKSTPKVKGPNNGTRSNTKKPLLADHLSGGVQTAQNSSSTGPCSNNSALEAEQMTPKNVERRKVARVKRSRTSKTKELHTAASDPLPEALSVTKNLDTVTQNQTKPDTPMVPEAERLQKGQECKQNTETDIRNDAETKMDTLKGSSETRGENYGTQKSVRKRSLMDPNGRSYTLEWDDDVENVNLRSPSSPRLVNPKAIPNSSPSKKSENGNSHKRRARKRWSPLEEDTLREGVHKYGRGSWKAILMDDDFAQVFQGRTEVDLKDKWRNMTRYTWWDPSTTTKGTKTSL